MMHEIVEFQRTSVDLSHAQGFQLWAEYSKLVTVDFPSPRTGGRWEVVPTGGVGFLPLNGTLLSIKPRVPVASIFRMWETAYDVPPRLLPATVRLGTTADLFSWVIQELATRVQARLHRGLYRSYVTEGEALLYVRGRIQFNQALQQLTAVKLQCEFDEHTPDIEDNRLLAAALRVAARGAGVPEGIKTLARHGYLGLLQQSVTSTEPAPSACLGRQYDRLNADYREMHGLCHFILSHTSPTLGLGTDAVQPFIIPMPALFERFVRRWLLRQWSVMDGHRIEAVKGMVFGQGIRLVPDLVLRQRGTGAARLVIDTKYKLDDSPSEADVTQVVAYAEALDCSDAVLLYPRTPHNPVDTMIGRVRLRTLGFPLDADLDTSGAGLLRELGL